MNSEKSYENVFFFNESYLFKMIFYIKNDSISFQQENVKN